MPRCPARARVSTVHPLVETPAGSAAAVDLAIDEPGVGQPCKVTGSAIGG